MHLIIAHLAIAYYQLSQITLITNKLCTLLLIHIIKEIKQTNEIEALLYWSSARIYAGIRISYFKIFTIPSEDLIWYQRRHTFSLEIVVLFYYRVKFKNVDFDLYLFIYFIIYMLYTSDQSKDRLLSEMTSLISYFEVPRVLYKTFSTSLTCFLNLLCLLPSSIGWIV